MPLPRKFMTNALTPMVTFLAPSLWMNLPSRVVNNQKMTSQEVKG